MEKKNPKTAKMLNRQLRLIWMSGGINVAMTVSNVIVIAVVVSLSVG